jgi:hypothetical protein
VDYKQKETAFSFFVRDGFQVENLGADRKNKTTSFTKGGLLYS